MAGKSKKGKKRWVRIVGPVEFKNSVLGEGYVVDPNMLIGKKVKLNLGNLIGDPRKQSVAISFKIKEVKGAEAHAEVVSYEMLQSHVKRLVRTGQDKIDDSFLVESKDKLKLRVKPIMLTRNKANNSILSNIRLKCRERIKDIFLKESFNNIFSDIITGQLQRGLKQELRKVYPISIFDIRRIEILNR